MNIREVSFDTLGVYANSTTTSKTPNIYLHNYNSQGNVILPPYFKKQLNELIKLSKEQKKTIYRLKNIDEINDFFYKQGLNRVVKFNSNRFSVFRVSNADLKLIKSYNISNNNLSFIKGSLFYKACMLSKSEVSLMKSENFHLKYQEIPTKSKSGKIRTVYVISNKSNEPHKVIAQKLNIYLNQYQRHLFKGINSFAYQSTRSYKNFLEVHCNAKYLIKLDIKNFFESITQSNLEQQLSLYMDQSVVKLYLKMSIVEKYGRKFLGQGLPNAAPLSNIYMLQFDKEITSFCKSNKLKYSRYCDDILISSQKEHVEINFEDMIAEMLLKYDLKINFQKTKIQGVMHTSTKDNLTIGNIKISDSLYLPNSYFTKIYNTIINILYRENKNDIEKLVYYYAKYIEVKATGDKLTERMENIELEFENKKSELDEIVMKHIRGKIEYAIHINKYDYNLARCIKVFNEASRLNFTNCSPIYNHPIYTHVILILSSTCEWIPYICKLENNYVTVNIEEETIGQITSAYYMYRGQYRELFLDLENCYNGKYKFISYESIKMNGVQNDEQYNQLERQVKYFYTDKKRGNNEFRW